MVVSSQVMCVVCEKQAAVVWCEQDMASLCKACDEQVHSANPLASRHVRVAIEQCAHVRQDDHALSEARSVFDKDPCAEAQQEPDARPELAFDDDAFFAVPDIDLPGSAADDSAAKNVLGKTFVSDEFDFGEIDPLWLDRLDVGLDRLPSDILDSLVPEAPPPAKAAPAKVAEAPVRVASPPRAMMQPPPMRAHPHPHMQHPAAAPVHVPHPGAMHHYAPHTMVPHYAPPAEPAAAWEEPPAAPTEAPMDIDSYIPRSLLPVDPSTRVQLLRARREKLERFREKKRTRHFKKTIRYASRKAYAEVRPRIKGRFARKDEVAAMRAAGLLPAA